jgi:hypothetical protein
MRTLAVLLVLGAAPALAQPAGNLPPGFYPRPSCEKPQAPGKPPESANQAAMQLYNAKVKAFNGKVVTFNACMQNYRDRAQNDVDAILATVHAAVVDANAH